MSFKNLIILALAIFTASCTKEETVAPAPKFIVTFKATANDNEVRSVTYTIDQVTKTEKVQGSFYFTKEIPRGRDSVFVGMKVVSESFIPTDLKITVTSTMEGKVVKESEIQENTNCSYQEREIRAQYVSL